MTSFLAESACNFFLKQLTTVSLRTSYDVVWENTGNLFLRDRLWICENDWLSLKNAYNHFFFRNSLLPLLSEDKVYTTYMSFWLHGFYKFLVLDKVSIFSVEYIKHSVQLGLVCLKPCNKPDEHLCYFQHTLAKNFKQCSAEIVLQYTHRILYNLEQVHILQFKSNEITIIFTGIWFTFYQRLEISNIFSWHDDYHKSEIFIVCARRNLNRVCAFIIFVMIICKLLLQRNHPFYRATEGKYPDPKHTWCQHSIYKLIPWQESIPVFILASEKVCNPLLLCLHPFQISRFPQFKVKVFDTFQFH